MRDEQVLALYAEMTEKWAAIRNHIKAHKKSGMDAAAIDVLETMTIEHEIVRDKYFEGLNSLRKK